MREGKTRPGQSQRTTLFVMNIVWKYLVWPGVFETLATFRPFIPFKNEDFPTFGKPIINYFTHKSNSQKLRIRSFPFGKQTFVTVNIIFFRSLFVIKSIDSFFFNLYFPIRKIYELKIVHKNGII